MGQLIIPNAAPKDLDKDLWRDFLEIAEVPQIPDDNNEAWVRTEVQIGAATAVGASIMAAVAQSDVDIHVILTASHFQESRFEPEAPAVVLNLMKVNYLPSAEPAPMKPTVLLFHELGHAAQWITRRDWFMQSKAASDAAREDYYVEIEKDNLERHERPMCMELGVPCRWHYDDIYNNEGAAQQRWNKMKTAVMTIEKYVIRNKAT